MNPRPAVFGKLPTHGDFVARGLEGEARDAWDGWISKGLAEARERLGDEFSAAHEAAAPWRFVDGPGPLGEGWRAGALAASIDRAQRRFVIVAMADGLEAEDAAARGAALAERLEQAIYDAFAGGWDVDQLLAEAERTISDADPGGGEAFGSQWWTDEDRLPGPAPDALWPRMFKPLSATEAA